MNFVFILLYVYLILKPFYIFASGGLQISDIFLVLSFVLLLINKSMKKRIMKVIASNYKFLLFFILSSCINLIYFIVYVKFKFILSSLYFLFNFFAIILFSFVFDDKKAIKNISKILKFNLILQVLIFFAGLGRFYGSVRYMGTFNDPNQFSYYVLTIYMFLYLISINSDNHKGNILYLFISIFLILQSASTGMLVGILIFLFLQFFYITKNVSKFIYKYKTRIVIVSFTFLSAFLIFYLVSGNTLKNKIDNLVVFDRITEKINRVEKKSNSNISIIQERGYDRFIYYPQYILYGSGEGEYTRFTKTFHQDEIHATFPSILFYYGIIPTLILLSWVYDKVKRKKINVIIPFIAIFIESFTLLNQRQVMFWLIILFISYIKPSNTLDDTQTKE